MNWAEIIPAAAALVGVLIGGFGMLAFLEWRDRRGL